MGAIGTQHHGREGQGRLDQGAGRREIHWASIAGSKWRAGGPIERLELTGDALAVLDLAWPDGLQEGFSQPVAVLIDEDTETESIVNQAGYLFFTDVDNFKAYVRDRILAMHDAAD